MPWPAAMCWGATTLSPPFLRETLRPEDLSQRGFLTKSYSRLCGAENTERKGSPAGRNPPGNSLREEIDAIDTVIELDIISITIIIISTIITAVSTAGHRIAMDEVRKKLFSLSLSSKAAHWYKLLDNGDSLEWNDIVPRFYSKFYHGLCDIGASISAIPDELYTEIMHEIGSCELEDIDVVIRLANRETISPIGIVRDVEVLCDCKKEKILTKFAGESYEFNFSKFTKTPYKADLPNDDFKVEQCASIVLAPNNPLQQHLENSESEVFREERDELDEIFLHQPILKHDLPVEDLGTTPPPKEDPVFDLKPLPARPLEILKKHRGAIGYTLDELKGISPSICQHAINMEDDVKPVVEPQRRLIPKMKDVVRNEVLRLLEAGIIYPIADSRWVSPGHCVPKKGGMTVVPNDNDELIPQRVVLGYRMCIDYRKVNKEKCHFMVNEGIVLGHKISERGIEVDRAKVEAIEKMPYPRDVKGIRSVLGHAGFYRRFIKDFSKISKPLTNLLQKDVPFVFDDDCKEAFETLKKALTTAPIVEPPDWNLPFEIMCDASDFA
ncbi:hypothetical protein QYE76_035496 [Lolium multiflorum]|uniref:Reverse transcriptase/retrotransposon-derived protein RNase H-like domain-containing protein n=1 Tax=Lolium multiflorum TaxID=4521 RepID=A0AAD8VP95_LOLMU|nr:hypothetical protein QYE76_035496 [Lolium multiflorum]